MTHRGYCCAFMRSMERGYPGFVMVMIHDYGEAFYDA
jgi:hypothetical protein